MAEEKHDSRWTDAGSVVTEEASESEREEAQRKQVETAISNIERLTREKREK